MRSLLLVGLAAFCVGSISAFAENSPWDSNYIPSGKDSLYGYTASPPRPGWINPPLQQRKVVCFWNSTSFQRGGTLKFEVNHLKPALAECTHLIYGYAGIDSRNKEVVPLHSNLDTEAGHGFYRKVIALKRFYPNLKIYLSVGGDADPYEKSHKYLTVTETASARSRIITSVTHLANFYGFDGVDLAWQFPPVAAKKNNSIWGAITQAIQKRLGYGDFKDKKEAAHRNGFANLVRDLKRQLGQKSLTITVLPHVSTNAYYDVRNLIPYIDAVHLMAFDRKTPERNPAKADYTAPIYSRKGDGYSVNDIVGQWLEKGTPGSKIIVGIPTFARAWRIASKKHTDGKPPIVADGPGSMGMRYNNSEGLLSYTEVCTLIHNGRIRNVGDVNRKYGSYAFAAYNGATRTPGTWIGYDSPFTAGDKAKYVKSKGLGGIAIFDLSNDDFRGLCHEGTFPILIGAVTDLKAFN